MRRLYKLFIFSIFIAATFTPFYAYAGIIIYYYSKPPPYVGAEDHNTLSKEYLLGLLDPKMVKQGLENNAQQNQIASLRVSHSTLKAENLLMKKTLADANIPIKLSEESEQTEETIKQLIRDLNSKPKKMPVITKNHWLAAISRYFNGSIVAAGPEDDAYILTRGKVIAVDDVSYSSPYKVEYYCGRAIEQVLKHSKARGKEPVLVLYIDGRNEGHDGYEFVERADKLCKKRNVTLLVAHNYVSINDIIRISKKHIPNYCRYRPADPTRGKIIRTPNQVYQKFLKQKAKSETQQKTISLLTAACTALKKENLLMTQALTEANIPRPKLSEEAAQAEETAEQPPEDSNSQEQIIHVITEDHWLIALNEKKDGKIEIDTSTGKAYIARYIGKQYCEIIYVDRVSRYQEGIEQVLKYTKDTFKKPVLALYIDGEKNGYELFQEANKLCKEKEITLFLANDYVSVNEFIEMSSDGIFDEITEANSPPVR